MNRDDFPILKQNIIYFDNSATTLKPNCLISEITKYYSEYSSNIQRGEYDIAMKADVMYERTREVVKKFINARRKEEIVFTSGATDSLNKIIFGYFKDVLQEGDEVVITKAEHASNVLPWFELSDSLGIKIRYVELAENLHVTLENVKKVVNQKTKVISMAHVSNVVGDVRPIKEICQFAHKNGILVVCDAAQSIGHTVIDVVDMDVDFLAFSAHKTYGPTGVGVLYGKYELLNNIKPIEFGGGMNSSFSSNGVRIYHELPSLLEAGTPNIAGIISFGSVIDYLDKIGLEKINKYEMMLKKYAVDKLKEIDKIVIYNDESDSGIISFNYDGIFAQDLAIYLNKYHICVRAGNHCAKILKDEIGIKNTVRISFALYNTKEEIDKLVEALKKPDIINCIL